MPRPTTYCAALLLSFAALPAHATPTGENERKPLRVLLAASAPTREYQFLRTFLVHQLDKKKIELCVFVQPPIGKPDAKPAINADLAEARHLKRFPDRFGDASKDKAGEKYYNLTAYDVVVAFDLDWDRLKAEQVTALSKWVKTGNGLVVVAGPVYASQLTGEAKAEKDKAVRELYPVVVDKEKDAPREKAWRLTFAGVPKDATFLQLDAGKDALAGWEEFFTGKKAFDKDAPVLRGFYSCIPVKSVKKEAVVLAKLGDGKEQPFLVTMPLGKGRVLYLSSGELWRLRQYRETAHERLWSQLLEYTAGRAK